MSSQVNKCNVWMKFEAKRKDGSVVKLRLQDLPRNRMDDLLKFMVKYMIPDESFHKAAGIYKNEAAIEEYKSFISMLYEFNPPEVAICCLDNDAEGFEEILAVSIVQLTSSKMILESLIDELKPKCNELQAFLMIFNALPKFPQSLEDKYENRYDGRGIVVRPDYRKLGIATHIVKQRRMMCDEHKVPVTSAWMTTMGSQKPAERNGWDTISEVTPEELSNLTGLEFENSVPTYKLMMAPGYNS